MKVFILAFAGLVILAVVYMVWYHIKKEKQPMWRCLSDTAALIHCDGLTKEFLIMVLSRTTDTTKARVLIKF